MKERELPEGWKIEKLEDILKIDGGFAFKSENFTANSIPIVRIGNIVDGNIELDYNICYDDNNGELKKYYINNEDILIAMSGATTGKLAMYRNNEKCLLNQRVGRFSIYDKEKLDRNYLYYYLRSNFVQNKIKIMASGCAQPNISPNQILSICIPVSPLEIQKKIVEVLEKAERVLEKRKEANKLLDKLVKSRFIEMFGDLENNTYNYAELKIWKICEKITDGTHKTPRYINDGIKFISAKDIKTGKIDLTDTKFISLEEYEEIQKRCQLEKGDILLSKSGSIGTPVILDTDESLGIFESLAVIKLKKNIVNNIYICEFLKSDWAQRRIVFGTKGISIKHLHLNVLKELDVLLPPIELQNQFADFVKQVDKLKFRMEKSLRELENNFNSLMQKAFKGELFN